VDVTCERCSTEYEFDETLVSDRGTTVKCTHCGHLFKVFRPSGAADGGHEAIWRVRRGDGTIETVTALRELQRRIMQGALAPEDEISASGQPWKPLGAIAELATFFASAEGARAPSSARPDVTGPFEMEGRSRSSHAPTEAETTVVRPPRPGRPAREKRTLIGVGVAPAISAPEGISSAPTSQPPPSALPAEPPGASSSRPAPRLEAAPSDPPPRPTTRTPSTPLPAPAEPATIRQGKGAPPKPQAPGLRLDPELRSGGKDEARGARPHRRRFGAGTWLLLLLIGLGVGAYFERDRVIGWLGPKEDPIAPFLARGAEALATDEIEAYQDAIFELTRATGLDARDARALTGLSRAHGVWAQALSFEALDEDRGAAIDPASVGEARRARSEMARHVEMARRFAEDAVRADPAYADAELALADALRLGGELDAAVEHLGRARDAAGVRQAELHRAAALLAAAQADDLAAAVDEARLAVDADRDSVRNRVLLARALLASGDVLGARRELEEAGRDHELVAPIVQAIDAGAFAAETAPILEGEATPEEAAPTAAEANPSGPAIDERATTESARAAEGTASTDAVPRGRDYSWYVRRGESLLSRGDVRGAKAHFDQALAVRPGSPEALTGLGFAALQSGNASGAASRFRQAAASGYGDAYIGLGDAYRRVGRTDDARKAYERYLERWPGGSQASIARQKLERLGPAAPPEPAPEPAPAAPAEPSEPAPEPAQTTGAEATPAPAEAPVGAATPTDPPPTEPSVPSQPPGDEPAATGTAP
jgi:predicted Zn finger-like uncharacterized protein